MLRTYEATLNGNQIDFCGEAPPPGQAIRVRITVLEDGTALEDERSDGDRGQQMATALDRLAKSGAFSNIDAPSEWQREVRAERSLPSRKVE